MSGYSDMDIDGGSGDYLRLKSGEVVTFNILSRTPEKNVIHWIDKKKTNCLGKDACDFCAEGNKPKQRWTITVWDRKEQKEKKLEFGPAIASHIKAVAEMQAENQQTIHQTDIRIKTSGSGLETEYAVLPCPMIGSIPNDIMLKYRSDDEVPF